MSSRNQYNGRFKAQVALEAIKNQRTIGEIAHEYGIHPSQIHKWKKHVLDELPNVFSDNGRIKEQQDHEKLQSELYQHPRVRGDQLKVELEYSEIPIYRQCELLGLSRSSFYYKPVGISEYNLLLMDMIRKYTEHSFYGILRMTAWLRGEGHEVNHKRIQRLMQMMGLKAIYPKPRLSKGGDVSIPICYEDWSSRSRIRCGERTSLT